MGNRKLLKFHKTFVMAHKYKKPTAKEGWAVEFGDADIIDVTDGVCNERTFADYGYAYRSSGGEGQSDSAKSAEEINSERFAQPPMLVGEGLPDPGFNGTVARGACKT